MSVRDIIQAAAGQGGDKLFVEDVMSTYLYTGNGSTQTITNGIDLAGEGGMVWIKGRSGQNHMVHDTVRGVQAGLSTNLTDAQYTSNNGVTAFNAGGFSIGSNSNLNANSVTYASWTFRKAPKFFDVVTYTGTGANRTVAHDLGSVPGMIIVKRTDTTGDWQVYHRANTAAPETDYLVLNSTAATVDSNTRWNDTQPTSTVFSLGTEATVNASGGSYVAYLFAHDAGGFGDTGDENVVSCGSYVGNGSATGPVIDLGWEPQYLMIKRTALIGSWVILDSMRGMTVGSTDAILFANNANAESFLDYVSPTATGFQIATTNLNVNISGNTYIYLAIRRPMKTPESGTEVFNVLTRTGTGAVASITNIGLSPDLIISKNRNIEIRWSFQDKLRGAGKSLESNNTTVESDISTSITSFTNVGYNVGADESFGVINLNGSSYSPWCFRRAPGFFDVVCYTGTGVARTLNHNLGVAPEFIIVKDRSVVRNWICYVSSQGNNGGIYLNLTNAWSGGSDFWNNTTPTSSVFSVGGNTLTNSTSETYVAYLFATLAGVSKVGSYTGTGTTLNVDCGFTGGARFVMIKRTDAVGDWYVWDTARGIVAGNDPYLLINSAAAEITSTDYIDPLASGFQISSTAPAAINASGGSFIFYAVS